MEKIKWINDRCVKIDGDYFIRHSKEVGGNFVKEEKKLRKNYVVKHKVNYEKK